MIAGRVEEPMPREYDPRRYGPAVYSAAPLDLQSVPAAAAAVSSSASREEQNNLLFAKSPRRDRSRQKNHQHPQHQQQQQQQWCRGVGFRSGSASSQHSTPRRKTAAVSHEVVLSSASFIQDRYAAHAEIVGAGDRRAVTHKRDPQRLLYRAYCCVLLL